MIASFIAGLVLIALIAILPVFPWPAIPSELGDALYVFFSYLWSFNEFIPVDTIIKAAFLIIGIEFLLFLVRIAAQILGFIAQKDTPLDHIGKKS